MSSPPTRLAWLPTPAATGVGSLPHRDPRLAVRLVAETCPALPFWPQLPGCDPAEAMLTQPLRGLPPPPPGSLSRWAAAADLELPWRMAPGLQAFLAAWEAGAFPAARAVKGQLTGPWTLAVGLGRPRAVEVLGALLAAQAAAQVRLLSTVTRRPVLLVLDEPCLGVPPAPPAGAKRALTRVLEAVHAAGAGVGVHCCSPPPFGLLRALPLDLVSFDADQGLEAACADPELRAGLRDGWRLAWGLIPTGRSPTPTERLLARWRGALAGLGGDPEAHLARAIVTPACGLAERPPARARAALRAVARLASAAGSG